MTTPSYSMKQIYVVESLDETDCDGGTEISLDESGHVWLKDFNRKNQVIDQYTVFAGKARMVAEAILKLTEMK
jgi:hypothetical protein